MKKGVISNGTLFFKSMENNKELLLKALTEKPTNYAIEVSDNSMLPEELKTLESITFTVKPPVLSVLAKCALTMERIPETIKASKETIKLEDAINYIDEMAEVIAILAHGKTSDFPSWYVSFIINNVTPKDLFYLFQEVSLKTQSSFFLNSFQIANVANPLVMIQ